MALGITTTGGSIAVPPGSTVGPGQTYATVKEAVDAGVQYITVIGGVVETANIATGLSDIQITLANGAEWNLATFTMELRNLEASIALKCSPEGSQITFGGTGNVIESSVPSMTGDTSNGSAVVTNLSFGAGDGPVVGQTIVSANFPNGTRVLSVDSATQITADQNATGTGVGVQLGNTFSNPNGNSGITIVNTAWSLSSATGPASIMGGFLNCIANGKNVVNLPNAADVGIDVSNTTVFVAFGELALIGAGSSCSGCLRSTVSSQFIAIEHLVLVGAFDTSPAVISLPHANIDMLHYLSFGGGAISLELGGCISHITEDMGTAPINIKIMEDRTVISDSPMPSGSSIDIDSRAYVCLSNVHLSTISGGLDGLGASDTVFDNVYIYPEDKWYSLGQISDLRASSVSITNADSPYSLLQEALLFVDTTGGAVTVSLPSPTLARNPGRIVAIKKSAGTNAITVTGAITDGSPNYTIAAALGWAVFSCGSAEWSLISTSEGGGGGSGDVVGPASSTDNAAARFDGTTGKLLQNSALIVNDINSTTANILEVSGADSLTTGSALRITSAANSANVGRGVVHIVDNSTYDFQAALRIDTPTNGIGVAIFTGAPSPAITIDDTGSTTGRTLEATASAKTTGPVLEVSSTGDDASSRSVVRIIQSSGLATGAKGLEINQGADQSSFVLSGAFNTLEIGSSSAVAGGTPAGGGKIWVDNASPIRPHFVDGSGIDSIFAFLGYAQTFSRQHNFAESSLTDGATISWDLNTAQVATVTLAGDRTLANPTNMIAGGVYFLRVVQDGTGGRTLAFGNSYSWLAGAPPVVNPAPGTSTVLQFVSDGSTMFGLSVNLIGHTHPSVTALGVGALSANDQTLNTAIGSGALQSLNGTTNSAQNTALGHQAGENIVDANQCTAVGYRALNADADDRNTAVGALALENCTGQENVALGHNAGNNVTSGSRNTLLGMGADVSSGSRTGSIAIGIDTASVAANATVNDGLFFHPSLAAPATSQVVGYDTNGQMGPAGDAVAIGTTTPATGGGKIFHVENRSVLYGALDIADVPGGGAIGTAAATVDQYSYFRCSQTTALQTLGLPTPSNQTAGRMAILSNTGSTTFTFLGKTCLTGDSLMAMWDGSNWSLVSR